MRQSFVLVLLVSVLVASASAGTVASIPGKGDALSFLYRVQHVHTAKSLMDEVRIYEVCNASCSEVMLALQVVADNRPPAGKMARVIWWRLGYTLRRIDSLSLEGTVVRIEGWSDGQGALVCTAAFSISEKGVLSDMLEDRGCLER